MIRLSMLQFRAQAATAAAALAVFAVILAATGPHLFGMYDSSGIAACQAHGNCLPLATSFVNKLSGLYTVFYFIGIGFLLLVPAVIGTFWAAPLLTREFEAGTNQLAWTQSVTRTRWLAAKLGVGSLAAMATAGLFSLLLTWWSGPIDTAAPFAKGNSITFLRLGFVLFPTRGITPLGYAAFAFALGVTAGLLIRRTVPAMAATLATFLFIQIAWPIWARPHLIPPAHKFVALTAAKIPSAGLAVGPGGTTIIVPNLPSMTGDWIISTLNIDPVARPFNVNSVGVCQGNTPQACNNTLSNLHLRAVIAYQPASRFWVLQWYETGIFLAAAVLLAGFCFWSIRSRRLSR
jgi:ABC-type transport system involved in multi-copper enzyme maturation permease subunit